MKLESLFSPSKHIAQFTGIGRDKVFPAYVSVRINIPMVVVQTLIGIGAILAFWLAPEARTVLVFAAATVAALAGLYATFCTANAIKLRTLLGTLHQYYATVTKRYEHGDDKSPHAHL